MKKIAFLIGLLALVFALFLFTRKGEEASPETDAVSAGEETTPPRLSTNGIPSVSEEPSAPDHGHDNGQEEALPSGVDPLQGKRLSREEFQALSAQVIQELPTKASLSKLQEKDVHLMPEALRAAATQLGLVAQAVENEPSLKNEAFAFYESCAAKGDLPDSVRALCYSNYKKMGRETGQGLKPGIVPDSIGELAEQVEGM